MKFGVVFLVLLGTAGWLGSSRPLPPAVAASVEPGVADNQRLTELNGGPLLVLLGAIAVTIVFLPPLLPWHYLVGFLLIPPLALKFASTGYRFARYYLHDSR